jgi:hypothetical protein
MLTKESAQILIAVDSWLSLLFLESFLAFIISCNSDSITYMICLKCIDVLIKTNINYKFTLGQLKIILSYEKISKNTPPTNAKRMVWLNSFEFLSLIIH